MGCRRCRSPWDVTNAPGSTDVTARPLLIISEWQSGKVPKVPLLGRSGEVPKRKADVAPVLKTSKKKGTTPWSASPQSLGGQWSKSFWKPFPHVLRTRNIIKETIIISKSAQIYEGEIVLNLPDSLLGRYDRLGQWGEEWLAFIMTSARHSALPALTPSETNWWSIVRCTENWINCQAQMELQN